MQNFTLIGVTVAEISVTRQIDRITADKTHTNVAFLDKKTKYCALLYCTKCQQSQGRRTHRDRTPVAKATHQLVAGVEQFAGDFNADAVDALKHTVPLLNNRLQLLTDDVLHDVWLTSSWNH